VGEKIDNNHAIDERLQDTEALERACKMVMCHFDTVQIFASRFKSDGNLTYRGDRGKGNWFARYGQVKEWIVSEEEGFKNAGAEDNG
jgi:hypothetical protein